MSFWKNINCVKETIMPGCSRLLVMLLCLLAPALLFAQGIRIEHASSKLVENDYSLDAKILFDFDDDVLNALNHGIALNIDVIIHIKQKRKWLWDKNIKKDILHYELQYKPLSKDYLVSELTSGTRYQYKQMDEAIKKMGRIINHTLINASRLSNDKVYIGKIKAKLNFEALPAPLRPIASISPRWRLESDWYKWVIHENE